MRKNFYILIYIVLLISCSEDDEGNINTTGKAIATETVKSEVPRDRIVYNTFSKIETESLENLINLYKKDISTAEQGYMTNLKNMWFAILKDKLFKEGTEEQKLFFINEQLSVENNLFAINEFYSLVLNSKLLSRSEKESITKSFYNKNSTAINSIDWKTPQDKKKKQGELVYAARTSGLVFNTQQ
ncbi:hypothetical protein GCM10007424_26200 [Flavobacterium suaedae]|uniref:Uncharacterized protein n=1 Tax=Flavobacterium suaedae TaxID=1767027 RepID=A0ABQ1K6B8_9FLAO|nr:hypothetical protein [Flavobacterium suaedae]GGB84905.1 hypothetical protein GCM10007424_26200 [Flavobacterium suaedae]